MMAGVRDGGEAPAGSGRVVTLIVHGTFAREEWWWRPGVADAEISAGVGPTFADKLEDVLAREGLRGTVWTPVLKAGMTPSDFTWSGENLDRARVEGARALARRFEELAERVGCSEARPLELNIIAHSHGGNIALEALKHISARVRIRRLILLGTPLIEYRRSLRLLRAVLALFVITAMIIAFGAWVLLAADWLFGTFGVFERGDMRVFLTLVIMFFLVSSWMFVLFAALADRVWRAVCAPIDRLYGRKSQVYGPTPARLLETMRGRQVLLITSHHDEADLLLRLGSRPRKLFHQLVRKRWPWAVQLLELVFLRPFIDWLAFHMLEAVLEHYALGFSWVRCWLSDFRLTELDRSKAYPARAFRRVDVTSLLRAAEVRPPSIIAPLFEEPRPRARRVAAGDRHAATLIDNLQQVSSSLSAQIKLLHSRYYESEVIQRIIAQELTKEEVDWEHFARSFKLRVSLGAAELDRAEEGSRSEDGAGLLMRFAEPGAEADASYDPALAPAVRSAERRALE